MTFVCCSDGVMIAVECRAWAENIKHDRMERKGLAHFEVSDEREAAEICFLSVDDRLEDGQPLLGLLANVVNGLQRVINRWNFGNK